MKLTGSLLPGQYTIGPLDSDRTAAAVDMIREAMMARGATEHEINVELANALLKLRAQDTKDAWPLIPTTSKTRPYVNGNGAAPSADEPAEKFQLTVLTAREIADLPPQDPADFLVGPLLVRGQRCVIGGHTGEGKTTLTLQLIHAACSAGEVLGFEAPRKCKALVIDAEQGIESIKKKILEAGIEDLDVRFAVQPDGLRLDEMPEHYDALEEELYIGAYDLVVADPLYKLHAGESNDEQQAVSLMRMFDRWRTEFRFCLVMPVHCRKPMQGQNGKLTIHELFGSGAYTRGAEVVLGITRVADGYSRLHWLKDRDGGIPAGVGSHWGLIFDRSKGGFRRDPADTGQNQTTADKILYALSGAAEPLTTAQLKACGCGAERTIRKWLSTLHAEGRIAEHGRTTNNEVLYELPTGDVQTAPIWDEG